jgi:hypothetical protein
MQVDGNLVIYDSGGEPVWATNADGVFGAYLSVHNSGCVTVEREPYDVIWSKCD